MIRSIIVDDEQMGRNLLASLLDEYCPNVAVVAEADSVTAARDVIRRHEPELVFLDIEMPRNSGFDLLEEVEGRAFDVVFTTAYEQYAIRAIKAAALDYLLKPINKDELMAAVAKTEQRRAVDMQHNLESLLENLRRPSSEPHKLALPTEDGLMVVRTADIIRCEAAASYTWVYMTASERLLVSRPLKEFETLLAGMSFLRVHHSHMVNVDHIRRYVRGEGGELVMSDNSSVLVARRKKEELLRALRAPGRS
jgi:two-component system LytT family response regulator